MADANITSGITVGAGLVAVLVTTTLYYLKTNEKGEQKVKAPKSPLSKKARAKQKKLKHATVKQNSSPVNKSREEKPFVLPSVSFDSDDESDDEKKSTTPQHESSSSGTSGNKKGKKKKRKKNQKSKGGTGGGDEMDVSDSGTDSEMAGGSAEADGWETVTKKHKKKSTEPATNGGVKQGLDAIGGEGKE